MGSTTAVIERQDKIMSCTHAVRELPQRAAGYDCENNATVREGQGTTARTTPPLRDGQKPWGGHPSCGRTADYLPSGTVAQWYPVTGQWWNERQGGDPRTEQVTKGADSEPPGCQTQKETSFLLLVTKKRNSRTSVGGVSAQRGGNLKTPVCEGEGAQGPWRRGAANCCRLSRQLLVDGQLWWLPSFPVVSPPRLLFPLS